MFARGKFIIILTIFFLVSFASLAVASPINLLTFDESRLGVETNSYGSINVNFITGGAFATLRGDLLNSSYFGAGGTLPRSVNFLSGVSSLTSEALSGADVFILPYNNSLSSEEITALGDFMYNGGGIVFINNYSAQGFAEDILGVTPGPDGSSHAWVVDPSSPVVNGPFGIVAAPVDDPFNLMWNLSFSDLGPYGHEVLRSDMGIFGASFEYGLGRAVFFTDEELFMDPPYVPYIAAPNMNERSERMFLNSFAYVIPDEQPVIPEPATMILLGSGIIGLATLKRRKK